MKTIELGHFIFISCSKIPHPSHRKLLIFFTPYIQERPPIWMCILLSRAFTTWKSALGTLKSGLNSTCKFLTQSDNVRSKVNEKWEVFWTHVFDNARSISIVGFLFAFPIVELSVTVKVREFLYCCAIKNILGRNCIDM